MPMTTPSLLSVVLTAVVCFLAFYADRGKGAHEGEIPRPVHRGICILLFGAGLLLRFIRLGTLPAGLAAGEALIGVQAKALLQTGGYLGETGLPFRLAMYSADRASPLAALIAVPTVAMLGMATLAVRLPFALLSTISMAAAYGIGRELGGKRMGRFMLAFIAVSPMPVLTARLAESQTLILYLLPIALYGSLRALRFRRWVIPAMLILGLLPWAQDLWIFIAPVLILFLLVVLLRQGMDARLVWLGAALGFLLCLPGLMVIPHQEALLERLDRCKALLTAAHLPLAFFNKAWAVICGGVFQDMMHENIDYAVFSGEGFTALHLFSVPLILLGGLWLLSRRLGGERFSAGPQLMLLFAAAVFLAELFFGSPGILETNGTTSIWDYAAMLPFTTMLAATGACQVSGRRRFSDALLTLVFVLGTVPLGFFLLGGEYASHANVFFEDFPQAVRQGMQTAQTRGLPLRVTTAVYPHTDPDEAAEMMTLFSLDADMRIVAEDREAYAEIFWAEGEAGPAEDTVSVVSMKESRNWIWDADAFDDERIGRYVLLVPKDKETAYE